jgi:hypothetical protein
MLFVFGLGPAVDCDAGIFLYELRMAARAMKDAGVKDLALAAAASRKKKDVELEFVKAAATAISSDLTVLFVEQPTDEMAGLFA